MIKAIKKQLKITKFGNIKAEIDSYLHIRNKLYNTKMTTTERGLLLSILNDDGVNLKTIYEMMLRCLELIEQTKTITDTFIKKATQKRTYFSIIDGEIKEFTQNNNDKDVEREKDGNKYDTYKDAEFAYRKNKITKQLQKFAKDNNTEDIDWSDFFQDKWYFSYDTDAKEIVYLIARCYKYINEIYFTSEKLAQQAVKEVGEDRIKKYIFERGEKDE